MGLCTGHIMNECKEHPTCKTCGICKTQCNSLLFMYGCLEMLRKFKNSWISGFFLPEHSIEMWIR